MDQILARFNFIISRKIHTNLRLKENKIKKINKFANIHN